MEAVVSDLGEFNEWSPWFELDPDARYTMSGTPGTVGSRLAWASDKREVGAGSQTITGIVPNELVQIELDFEGDVAQSYYKLAAVDGGTRVAWGFDTDLGANPYMHYFAVFMDAMLGPLYERGLGQLKNHIENDAN